MSLMRNILTLVFVLGGYATLDPCVITFKFHSGSHWATEDITVGNPPQSLLLELSIHSLELAIPEDVSFSLTGQSEESWGLRYNPFVSTTARYVSERFGFCGNFLELAFDHSVNFDMLEESGSIDILQVDALNQLYSTIVITLGSVIRVEFQGGPRQPRSLPADDHSTFETWYMPNAVWQWKDNAVLAGVTRLELSLPFILFPKSSGIENVMSDPELFSWRLCHGSVYVLWLKREADYSQFPPFTLTVGDESFAIPWARVGCSEPNHEAVWCSSRLAFRDTTSHDILVGIVLIGSVDRLILDTLSSTVRLEGLPMPLPVIPRSSHRWLTFHPPVVFVDMYGRSSLRLYHSSVSLPPDLPFALPELAGSSVWAVGSDSDFKLLFYHGAPESAKANIVLSGMWNRAAPWTNPRSLHERLVGLHMYKELQLQSTIGFACTVNIAKQNGLIEITCANTLPLPSDRVVPDDICSICRETVARMGQEIRLRCKHTFHVDKK